MTAAPNQLAVVETKAPLRAGGGVQSIVPQDAEQAFRMAQMIYKSGLAPKDMNSAERIVTAIIAGMEIGLKPFQSVQGFAVVNGRPTLWGDAALGLIEASGLVEDFEESVTGDGDAMIATCRAKRSTRKTEIVRHFSVADAKKAGLWGKQGPWTQYPKRMLQLRARAFALRDGFSDVLKGMHIQEEVADYSGPSSERVASESTPVTPAALIAQGSETPADTNERAEQIQTVFALPDLPPEDGDRNGWLKTAKAQIAAADAGQIAALVMPELPDALQGEIARAVKKRSGELSQAQAGK